MFTVARPVAGTENEFCCLRKTSSAIAQRCGMQRVKLPGQSFVPPHVACSRKEGSDHLRLDGKAIVVSKDEAQRRQAVSRVATFNVQANRISATLDDQVGMRVPDHPTSYVLREIQAVPLLDRNGIDLHREHARIDGRRPEWPDVGAALSGILSESAAPSAR